jgi:protein-disulfide isomerase
VGTDFTHIEPGPTEAELYLLDKSGQRLRIAELTYPQEIGIDGSPFKGAEDAPVVIVEYTDFQCPLLCQAQQHLQGIVGAVPRKDKNRL